MESDIVRLECLRLACDHSGSPGDVVDRAQAYADFVLGEAAAIEPEKDRKAGES